MDLLKKRFFVGLTILSSVNPLNAIRLSSISMTNQECKVRPQIAIVNSDEPVFYPYAKMCVPDVVKNLNVKGNPNFQEILNWILQILHYYCMKLHKNIKSSRIIEQNLVLSSHFSLFTATFAFLNGRIFSFLEQSTSRILNVTSNHSCYT